jgi:arsenite/tail-anchored protein-transporting ATPase
MRLIIYTGKGGVGKTSVSAATALRSAAKGHRTIVMSTDSAHSLSDSLDMEMSGKIEKISPNLDALEIDIITEMKSKWNDIQAYVSSFLLSQGMEDLSAEEMAILPGMEMVAALFYILEFKEKDMYDVVVMDTAPTGETLRLLSFPDVSGWYIDKMFHLLRKVLVIARATVAKVIDFPLPSDDVLVTLEDLKETMRRVKVVLEDPKNTTIRLVVNPERMVINETKRAYSYLSLYNKNVEALIVNRVYPDDMPEYFSDKLKEQAEYMEMIHHAFDPMKMIYAYQMPTEMLGIQKLEHLADMLFEDSDPTEVYADESPLSFKTEDGIDYMMLKLPFAEKGDVELYRTKDGSLILHVGSQKRSVNLPTVLINAKIIGAEFKNDVLTVKFRRKSDE